MDRAFFGNLHKALARVVVRDPSQCHDALNMFEVSWRCIGCRQIFTMFSLMAQIDGNMGEADLLAIGIHADRHGGAGTQRGKEQLIG